jgi:hypothetical protein
MADWRKLVRQRLSGLALDAAEKEEVALELAAHLEESYEALLKEGMPEQAAAHRSLSQVNNWQELQRKIVRAKRREPTMQKRLQQLWIPGLLTLTLSNIFLMTLQRGGFQPRIISWTGPGTILFYVPWLLALPVFGAMGAYLSTRAGGPRRAALVASIFPVLTNAATFFVILPVGLIIDRHVPLDTVAIGVLMGMTGWVLIPGAALLVGWLPVHLLRSRRLTSEHSAIN